MLWSVLRTAFSKSGSGWMLTTWNFNKMRKLKCFVSDRDNNSAIYTWCFERVWYHCYGAECCKRPWLLWDSQMTMVNQISKLCKHLHCIFEISWKLDISKEIHQFGSITKRESDNKENQTTVCDKWTLSFRKYLSADWIPTIHHCIIYPTVICKSYRGWRAGQRGS